MSTAVITLGSSDSESDSDLPEVDLGVGGGRSDDEAATEVADPEEDEEFLKIVSDLDEEDEVETLISEDEVLVDTQPEESEVFTVADSDSDEEDGPVHKRKSNQIVQYIGPDDVLGARFKRQRVFDSDSESESAAGTELWDSKTAIFIGTF